MSSWRQIAEYAAEKVLLGFGDAKGRLRRRGLNAHDEVDLSVPAEGEQVSEDGTVVYLSGRVTEECTAKSIGETNAILCRSK